MTLEELSNLLSKLENAVSIKGYSARRRLNINAVRAEIINGLSELLTP